MIRRVLYIAHNTFREAVRDRVLYNLVIFALLMIGAAILFGQISVGIERIVIINLGLSAMSIFGALIAMFIGIGLVSKEIEKRTLYTLLAHPVRRWEFIAGKFAGLAGTLAVNACLMGMGVYAALWYVAHRLTSGDVSLLGAMYCIVLQLVIITAVALLFSSFASPVMAAVYTFALFVIGSFDQDLHAFAGLAHGATRWLAMAAAYAVPNFASLNFISSAAHGIGAGPKLLALNSAYAAVYCVTALAGATAVFERRNLK
ncbi:MAG: ABC transporter permease subunit [Acidobacteria bacterium]|nr:ABC transporter permease subunit [Acidobacteriota bacterium]